MICKIEYFSEMDIPESNNLQIQDELIEGDMVYITKKHQMTIETVIINDNQCH